jgi:hypothetical protein
MRRRDPTILLTLCVALFTHLAILRIGAGIARRELGWWQSYGAVTNPKPMDLLVQKLVERPDDLIGEAGGKGKSVNSAPGEQAMQSAVTDLEQEQAMMSRDPIGLGGTSQNKSIPQGLAGDQGDGRPKAPQVPQARDARQSQETQNTQAAQQANASVVAAAQAELAAPPPPHSSAALPEKLKRAAPTNSDARAATDAKTQAEHIANPSANAPAADLMASGPLAFAEPMAAHAAQSPPTKTADAPQPQPAQPSQQQSKTDQTSRDSASPAEQNTQTNAKPSPAGTGQQSGNSEVVAGKPLPSGDFESMPVSSVAAQFVAGKIEARGGRKMLTRRLPELGLGGWADVATLQDPVVVMQLTLDEKGNVTDAVTIHSSGSDNIDLPCERAAQTWWFEPRKNPKTGKAGPEIIRFSLIFR